MAFLEQEYFEGAGTAAGFFRGGSADFDYSASPISGSQSLRLNPASSDYANWAYGSDINEVWISFRFRLETMPASAAQAWKALDTGFNDAMPFYVFADGSTTIDFGSFSSAGSISTGVDYFVWIHFFHGTPCSTEVRFNTVDDRAGAPLVISSAATYPAFGQFLFMVSDGMISVIDDFQVADTDEFAGGGGGGGALAGSASLSLTSAGTLTASGALVGSASISLSGSATLSGKGACVGSASIAISSAGTLTSSGALSGSGSITLTASGSLTPTGALSGLASLSIQAAGTLTGSGRLQGSASITMVCAATFTGTVTFQPGNTEKWTLPRAGTRWQLPAQKLSYALT